MTKCPTLVMTQRGWLFMFTLVVLHTAHWATSPGHSSTSVSAGTTLSHVFKNINIKIIQIT